MNSGQISLEAAAGILKVSPATVRNWMRSGVLGEGGLDAERVYKTLDMIKSGSLDRLNSRANRKHSSKPALNFTRGERSEKGSFYTPHHVVSEIISDYDITAGSRVADPCCGKGAYLIPLAQKYGNKIEIYGSDTDGEALNSAGEDLAEYGSFFCLKNEDSLLSANSGQYDFIFTNPPWGAAVSGEAKRRIMSVFPHAESGDSLEYFLFMAYSNLKEGGVMSFLLPESYLKINRFSHSRYFFLKNASILKIREHGRVFPEVFTKVISVDIKKETPLKSHRVITGSSRILQNCFATGTQTVINAGLTERERNILDKIYSTDNVFLKDNADWSLGIVTGNNKEFVSLTEKENYPYRLITGKNVAPYLIRGQLRYLKNDLGRMQQVPKNCLFCKTKLIYKFICGRPIFAYDDSGTFTLNSANIMVPRLEKYPLPAVLAILNSKLAGFIYSKKFQSIKVLRSHLEQIPFPASPDRIVLAKICRYSSQIIKRGADVEKNMYKIDGLVNKLYGVNL